jgi:hypothetical protein
LEHQHVRAFFIHIGVNEQGCTVFQGVNHIVGKILSSCDGTQGI